MSSADGSGDPYAGNRARLQRAVDEALDDSAGMEPGEPELRHMTWQTEFLRRATIASGETRAVAAARLKDAAQISFAKLGRIMDVTRARAAEIVGKGKAAEGRLDPVSIPEPQPVVAAIVTSRLGVLITKRVDGKPAYGFVSGEIEPGESPEDAGVREVKEETGLLVRARGEIGRRVHPATKRLLIYMAAAPTHGTKVFVGDEDELSEVRWASLAEADELMPGMFGKVREFLERTLKA